ncbi:GMC oxidoreductase-domain-containing protein [Mycena crocata]|nr:GMC oxidoreductase-domain-containing protein [Mycena crocata]
MLTSLPFDIIFAGGGTSGCLIAGRLAAADPTLRILILEAGEHTRGLLAHTQPGRFGTHLDPKSTTVTFNVATKPSQDVGGRSIVVPSARCIGGGSSVNFAMYTRGAASDYDDWETVYGNPGWGSKDLIPLFKKSETYQVKAGEPTHGYSGPLKVSYGSEYSDVGQKFLDVACKYDSARGATTDVNGLFSCNEYGRWQKWIDGETGTRSDVPHHFIYNQAHNENLSVLHGCRVKRVIFENMRAVGVEFVKDTVLNPDIDQTVLTARASRLVVVSAGTFGSPLILERSGIGAPDILKSHGVQRLVDLPGVGENYQDHNVVFVPYLASEEAKTMDAFFRGEEKEDDLIAQWESHGTGPLADNGLDAGIKLRPNAADLQELGPEFSARWETYFEHAPDKPVIWIGSVPYLGRAPPRKYYSVGYYTEYPVARGYVHISSGENANAPPDFDPGFLRDAADLATLKWGYKKSRELARRMSIYRGEYLPENPMFSNGSEANCRADAMPVDVSAPDIDYTREDDAAIEAYNRNFVQTAWHSLGTCAMKPRGDMGVVDELLNVYGVESLKIAGISVAPANVGGNTYSTALVIGEKAAAIIANELGIDGFT